MVSSPRYEHSLFPLIDLEAFSGSSIFELARELFPIHRSMTGSGVRITLDRLMEYLPLDVVEVPTGTTVLDWRIPQEWNIRDAFIAEPDGTRVVDYRQSNLHVVNGSGPVDAALTWSELQPHVHTTDEPSGAIPYRTDFYRHDWGFCVSRGQYECLASAPTVKRRVVIDSTLHDGSLTYGEFVAPGATGDEILVYTHICHPSLANDNVSGIVVLAFLAKALSVIPTNHSFRFVLAPATLGAITWLAKNVDVWPRIKAGLVLALLGDAGPFHYKTSRRANASIDRIAKHVLASADGAEVLPFAPFGYDERQFCSPGIDLPMGRLTRSLPAAFPAYHTSADNLGSIAAESLQESFQTALSVLIHADRNLCFVNQKPYAEPRLSQYELYHQYGDPDRSQPFHEATMWLLNLSDGTNDLLEISSRSGLPFELLAETAATLFQHQLLSFCEANATDL